MDTTIISAFPGCGKSYYYNEHKKNRIILDSDSSDFSWTKDENGIKTKERNPDFPQNYIKHIQENIGKADIIFVSSHDNVRKALCENDIPYYLFYPSRDRKYEWLQRFVDRGNNQGFVDFISDNWDKFIDEIEAETYPIKVTLGKNEYIDVLRGL